MHRVIVTDDKGNVVLDRTVDISLAGSNAERDDEIANMSPAEREGALAAYMAAPEICPFDCDHCRG